MTHTPIRSLILDICAGASNLIADLQWKINPTCETRLIDHVCWLADGLASRIFGLAYTGSREERRDILDGTIPWRYMTDRQKDICLREFGRIHIRLGYPEPAENQPCLTDK